MYFSCLIAAGWAAEGGTQDAWRKISEDVVSEYKVCPTDIPAFQKMYCPLKRLLIRIRKNILGALATGTIKNFGQLAKEHGFEVTGSAAANAKFRTSNSGPITTWGRPGNRLKCTMDQTAVRAIIKCCGVKAYPQQTSDRPMNRLLRMVSASGIADCVLYFANNGDLAASQIMAGRAANAIQRLL